MKKTILISFLFLFGINLVLGIPNPAPIYCENMGYTFDDVNCIFDDGNFCRLSDFYNGECGSEYIKKLDCVKVGESLEPGYECCKGLVSVGLKIYISNGICRDIVGDWPICAACGDGVCDEEYENECNCAGDCEKKTKCSDYTYSTCPKGCLKKCISSQCSGEPLNLICTDDCDGQGSCYDKLVEDSEKSVCGDGVCEKGESAFGCDPVVEAPDICKGHIFCPEDCEEKEDNHCQFKCNGDWLTPINCKMPDRYCENGCEDGKCNEVSESSKKPVCGNGVCEADEKMPICKIIKCVEGMVCDPECDLKCPEDCKDKEPTCGNGICEKGEDEKVIIGQSRSIPPSYIYDMKCGEDCKQKESQSNVKVDLEVKKDKKNKSKLNIKFSDGKERELKVMPETASEKAIEKLKLKTCSEENNCKIVLKEVGKEKEIRAVYEVSAEKEGWFLGLFKTKAKILTQIDAENGDVLKVKKPWWSFLVVGV